MEQDRQQERNKGGVTRFDEERACAGLNLFVPYHYRREAVLMDMFGEVKLTLRDLRDEPRPDWKGWMYVRPCTSETFLVIDRRLSLLDRKSKIIWERDDDFFHHDVVPGADGFIYALTLGERNVPEILPTSPIVDNRLEILGADGRTAERISFADLVCAAGEELLAHCVNTAKRDPDVFHINGIDIATAHGMLSNGREILPGDVLFCSRTLELIGVLDPRSRSLKWVWGFGDLELPHHPTFSAGSEALVFDNGTRRGYSSIRQINLADRTESWTYTSQPPADFFSRKKGAAQRLPNGNTLITDSYLGRAFEIEANGRIVWEYFNHAIEPEREGRRETAAASPKRCAIYRMLRIMDSI